MQLRMWTYDLAREQSPSLDNLRALCDTSLAGGYTALGLYMEHRFAYPSTPWSHGLGAVTPEMIEGIQHEYPQLSIVPFVNLLGHFEGMLYTEAGKKFREERFQGMQACPCNPEFQQLCRTLLEDTLASFTSNIVHIGGDETAQLGKCPLCARRVTEAEGSGFADGKAALYGEHFGPLAQFLVDQGRTPAVWGDMFLEHPDALSFMPRETLIFDWQYFSSPRATSSRFREQGFDVVCCPTIHNYNASWMHLPQSEANVRQHISAVSDLGALGVCLTTWENGLFGSYESILPAVEAAGRMLGGEESMSPEEELDLRDRNEAPSHSKFIQAYQAVGAESWAQLMGVDLQKLGGSFAFTGIRSSLKVRLLLNANPFLAWLYHHEEFSGDVGAEALVLLERAIQVAPDAAYRAVSEFVKSGVEFVRYADQARQAYANGLPGVATASLAPCRQIFDNLERLAKAAHLRFGGSLADVERCRVAREHVERVIRRIKQYGDGSLGYLPAFEHMTHPKFVPHDQGAWWLINKWANE